MTMPADPRPPEEGKPPSPSAEEGPPAPDVTPSEGARPVEGTPSPAADAGADGAPPAEESPSPGAQVDAEDLRERVVDVLKTVYDPEIPVDIYELGLVYDVEVGDKGRVHVKMTLTSPACPVAGSLPGEVETKVKEVDGVEDAEVELVWDPPWDPSRMSEAARLMLNLP